MTTNTPAPAQDFIATELRGIIDVCGDSPTAIVSVERMRLWLSKQRAPVADEQLRIEFTAAGVGYVSIEKARAAVETARMASAPVAGEAQPVAITTRCPSGILSMDGASLHMQRDGGVQIVIAEDDFTLEDDRSEGPDGPQGGVHWVARLPASEVAALRDFLTGHARPSDDALWDQTLTERDEYHDMADKLANAIADHLLVEIGEHSSSNCPWMRALEAIENAAPQASEAVPTDLLLEIQDYLLCVVQGSMSRNNSEALASELGDRLRAALSAQPGAQRTGGSDAE